MERCRVTQVNSQLITLTQSQSQWFDILGCRDAPTALSACNNFFQAIVQLFKAQSASPTCKQVSLWHGYSSRSHSSSTAFTQVYRKVSDINVLMGRKAQWKISRGCTICQEILQQAPSNVASFSIS